jgi:fermentation-respiration switch protein FrsA (DUF1100 family)
MRTVFLAAVGLIALHVADDNLLQPQPGTSAGDHLIPALLPLAALALAAWAFPRVRAGAQGALALLLAPLGVIAGSEAIAYTARVGPSGDDFSGLLAVPAGITLLALGVTILWRSRRTEDRRVWRYGRRLMLTGGGVVVVVLAIFPLALGYLFTHVARTPVAHIDLGPRAQDVTLTTHDGLHLAGTYVPSRNGAAVVAFPGRKGPQAPARMLIRHGYGVLILDRRGEGRSDGDPNAFGWGGTRDLTAAVDFLERRSDVHDGRIGGIGLSVGGELLLEAAASDARLKAVVSDGAGSRSIREEADMPGMHTLSPEFALQAALTAGVSLFSGHKPPPNIHALVGRIAPRPIFLIAAGKGVDSEVLNPAFYAAAGRPKTLWEIPEAGHVAGIRARPAEYERRVVGFFDEALLGTGKGSPQGE